jgi:hypothetical protein
VAAYRSNLLGEETGDIRVNVQLCNCATVTLSQVCHAAVALAALSIALPKLRSGPCHSQALIWKNFDKHGIRNTILSLCHCFEVVFTSGQ